MGFFGGNNINIKTEKAAKAEAKGMEKVAKKNLEATKIQANTEMNIAKLQAKQAEKQAKRELIREKKANQEGIYKKKIGPFTIKTYIIMAVVIVLGIMMLVQKIQGN